MERIKTVNGCNALLTGGLGSLGRAQASILAESGIKVTILDKLSIDEAKMHLTELGENVSFLQCDLNDLNRTQGLIESYLKKINGFDILINNAALIINRPFENFSLQEYEEQIRVNSTAAYLLSKLCAPQMKKKGWGKIINLTSVTLNGVIEGYVPYVASKGAMLGLTKSLARELGPYGICVNAIAPGAIVSAAEERVFGSKAEEYSNWVLEQQCLKKRLLPESVADLVHFLVSHSSDMITGQNLAVDGGW